MTADWHDQSPIYRQLTQKILSMILDETLKAGDALPSVRQVASDYQINPITVSKAYQELLDQALVEKKRGIGMFVTADAFSRLMISERERFLNEEWPATCTRIRRLGLDIAALVQAANAATEQLPLQDDIQFKTQQRIEQGEQQ
ncbi:GntR family transcriptional regulator [Undibacterium sp. MH2W]|uniref:GntR family transcriptional regulator n=1 Tax=Undibacterium sp. MH2W TaxID=3413044 RepID=UPI003BF2EDCE